jgi:hypothetical protein
VVGLRRHDRHSFGFGRLGQPEIHVESRGQPLTEGTLQLIARSRQPGEMKDRALHERSAGLLGRMLIQ